MSLILTIASFFILQVNAEIKKVTGPGVAPIGGCTPSEISNGKCTKILPGAAGKSVGKPISPEDLKANNEKSKKWIKKNDAFIASSSNAKLKKAFDATVQILPKCAVGIKGSKYAINGIGGKNPEFCPGHPLSGSRLPVSPEGQTMAGPHNPNKVCEVSACSGALVGSQETITTAAHCLKGKSPKDFCSEFVFVFHRTDTKTEFSKDEVAECESGTSVDTASSIENFNMNADAKTKDHAVLKLKSPVSEDVAQALEVRTTELNSSEELYASGHPRGTTRAISTLRAPKKVYPGETHYNYAHMEGYVQPGNSGGPLLDKDGHVVGFMSAVDDIPAGDADKRDPLFAPEGSPVCRSQAAPGPYKVEAITYGTELTGLVRSSSGAPQTSETHSERVNY